MSDKEKITILIPTKNRSDFLYRLLHYFADAKYQDWIFIGDSSNDLHIAETKKTIQSLRGRLKVKHFECPGLSAAGVIDRMNQSVTTPYCTITNDDDFLCVRGLDGCIDFLQSNSNYGAAHGTGIATGVQSGPYGSINYAHHYQQAVLNADSGSQRLVDYFASGPYTLVFSVHRLEEWREMFQGLMSAPWARQGFIFDELIPSSTSAIRNKVKELDCLYLVRFGHDRIYSQVNVYDWFTSQDWFPGFKDWHDKSVDELTRQDSICKEAAEEVFKQAISPYLGRLFSRLLPLIPRSYRQGVLSRLKDIAVQILGLQVVYNKILPRFLVPDEANLLPSLLKLSSPYHQDFMPIYRAITTPIGDENAEKREI